MNSISNNYLFIATDENSADISRLCLDCLKCECWVVLFTNTSVNISSIVNKQLCKESFYRFIVIDFSKIADINEKLLQMHDWKFTPSIVIVDLQHFIRLHSASGRQNDDADLEYRPLLFDICFLIATLSNYVLSTEKIVKNELTEYDKHKTIVNVILLEENEKCDFGKEQINLLIHLYYYKNNACNDFKELCDEIIPKFR